MDMAKLMAMLSKMDKKDLEKGLAQASELLKKQENSAGSANNNNSGNNNNNNFCNTNYNPK